MSLRRWILAGLIVLLVAGNAAAFAYSAAISGETILEPGNAQSEGVLYAQAIDSRRIVIGTRDSELIVLNGGAEGARASFPSSLRALGVTPSTIVAGGSDGSLTVYNHALQPVGSAAVEGQVSAIATNADGTFVVVHGPGGYANSATLSIFAGAQKTTLTEFDVPFNVTAVATTGDTVYIGTLNSRVRALSLDDGTERWTTTLNDPITALAASPGTDLVLAGDDAGGATLLTPTGDPGSRLSLGSSAIRVAGFDPGSVTWLAGDATGSIHAIDSHSEVVHGSSVAEREIVLVAETGDGQWWVVPREGAWQTFNPQAIDATRQVDRVGLAWSIFNAVAGFAVVFAALAQSDRFLSGLRSVSRAIWRSRLGYLFILPSALMIGIFTYYPTFMSVYYSFTNFSLRNETSFVGLDNYTEILRDDFYFRTGILNMVILTVAGVIKTLTMPLLAAELVYWLRNTRHQYVFRTLFVLPAVVPDLVFALLWKQVYDPNTGLLNQVLDLVGLEQFQRGWLGQDSTALWAIVWVGFPFISAFAFLIYLGGLLNINADLFDAARIDGAGVIARFRNIDAPLLVPQFRIMLFFAFAGTVQGFASIFILTGGGPGFSTYVPALQMYLRIADGDFGYASAIGVILFACVCVATYVVLHFRKQSIEDA